MTGKQQCYSKQAKIVLYLAQNIEQPLPVIKE